MSGEERRATTLWRRAAAAVKDGHSLWMARLMAGRRKGAGGRQFPDLEVAVIRATSHDPSRIDYTNAQRVFTWVRTSPSTFLRPLLLALSRRMQRTRSWVVALKGLLLIHGVFCSRTPLLDKIGRLPFDLSNFQANHLFFPSTFDQVHLLFTSERLVIVTFHSPRKYRSRLLYSP